MPLPAPVSTPAPYWLYLFPWKLLDFFTASGLQSTREWALEYAHGSTQKTFRRQLRYSPSHLVEFKQAVLSPLANSPCATALHMSGWVDRYLETSESAPFSKEFILDIDCQDINAQWNYLVEAILRMVDYVRTSFGWTQVLTVFSGNRGIHMYLLDPGARMLTLDEQTWLLDRLSELAVLEVDRQVTLRADHLTRVPFSPHVSGYLALPFDPFRAPPTPPRVSWRQPWKSIRNDPLWVRALELWHTFV
jgi:hypothetical protein